MTLTAVTTLGARDQVLGDTLSVLVFITKAKAADQNRFGTFLKAQECFFIYLNHKECACLLKIQNARFIEFCLFLYLWFLNCFIVQYNSTLLRTLCYRNCKLWMLATKINKLSSGSLTQWYLRSQSTGIRIKPKQSLFPGRHLTDVSSLLRLWKHIGLSSSVRSCLHLYCYNDWIKQNLPYVRKKSIIKLYK